MWNKKKLDQTDATSYLKTQPKTKVMVVANQYYNYNIMWLQTLQKKQNWNIKQQ